MLLDQLAEMTQHGRDEVVPSWLPGPIAYSTAKAIKTELRGIELHWHLLECLTRDPVRVRDYNDPIVTVWFFDPLSTLLRWDLFRMTRCQSSGHLISL